MKGKKTQKKKEEEKPNRIRQCRIDEPVLRFWCIWGELHFEFFLSRFSCFVVVLWDSIESAASMHIFPIPKRPKLFVFVRVPIVEIPAKNKNRAQEMRHNRQNTDDDAHITQIEIRMESGAQTMPNNTTNWLTLCDSNQNWNVQTDTNREKVHVDNGKNWKDADDVGRRTAIHWKHENGVLPRVALVAVVAFRFMHFICHYSFRISFFVCLVHCSYYAWKKLSEK